jgi:nitrate/nitrite transport system substrate-binding protein
MDRLMRLIPYQCLPIDNMKHLNEISRRKFILTAGATAIIGLGLKGCSSISNCKGERIICQAWNAGCRTSQTTLLGCN